MTTYIISLDDDITTCSISDTLSFKEVISGNAQSFKYYTFLSNSNGSWHIYKVGEIKPNNPDQESYCNFVFAANEREIDTALHYCQSCNKYTVFCDDNNVITFHNNQKGTTYTYKELIIQFLQKLVLSIQNATNRKAYKIVVAFPDYMAHSERKEIAAVLSNNFNIAVNDYNQIALASSLYLNKTLSKDMVDYSLCCMCSTLEVTFSLICRKAIECEVVTSLVIPEFGKKSLIDILMRYFSSLLELTSISKKEWRSFFEDTVWNHLVTGGSLLIPIVTSSYISNITVSSEQLISLLKQVVSYTQSCVLKMLSRSLPKNQKLSTILIAGTHSDSSFYSNIIPRIMKADSLYTADNHAYYTLKNHMSPVILSQISSSSLLFTPPSLSFSQWISDKKFLPGNDYQKFCEYLASIVACMQKKIQMQKQTMIMKTAGEGKTVTSQGATVLTNQNNSDKMIASKQSNGSSLHQTPASLSLPSFLQTPFSTTKSKANNPSQSSISKLSSSTTVTPASLALPSFIQKPNPTQTNPKPSQSYNSTQTKSSLSTPASISIPAYLFSSETLPNDPSSYKRNTTTTSSQQKPPSKKREINSTSTPASLTLPSFLQSNNQVPKTPFHSSSIQPQNQDGDSELPLYVLLDQPTQLTQSIQPTQPIQPVQPTQLNQPTQPIQPVQPTQPTQFFPSNLNSRKKEINSSQLNQKPITYHFSSTQLLSKSLQIPDVKQNELELRLNYLSNLRKLNSPFHHSFNIDYNSLKEDLSTCISLLSLLQPQDSSTIHNHCPTTNTTNSISWYEGPLKNNYREGSGSIHFHTGFLFLGSFKQDKRSGEGSFYYKNQLVFKGQFQDDSAIAGIITIQKTIYYEGSFTKGMFSGKSKLLIGDILYEGDYKENRRQGYSYLYYIPNTELFFIDESKETCRQGYDNSISILNKVLFFEGEFNQNIPGNLGTIYLNSSLKVLINFTNEIQLHVIFSQDEKRIGEGFFTEKGYTGEGALYYKQQDIMIYGHFKDYQPVGECKIYQRGNLIYHGQLMNTRRNNHGKEYENGKLIYDGYFMDDVRNGTGCLYLNDGKQVYCNYVHGCLKGFVEKP